MTFFIYHVIVTLVVALLFGAFIDVDHGISLGNLRCALSLDKKDCLFAGSRGFFHDLYFFYLCVLGVCVWGIHLMMDDLI